MKKFFVCSAVMAAMVLMVGCGGSDGGSNSGGYGDGSYGGGSSSGSYEGSGSSSSSSSSECDYGDYKCTSTGNSYYKCSGGSWTYGEYCSNGCNSSTGRCNDDSGSGSSSSSSSECDYGDYKCDGNSSYRCSGGSWSYDEYCSNGCSYSTGKCNSSSSSSSSSECDYGEYRCSYGYSQRCSSGKWVDDQSCLGVGCNDSTGKCKTQDEHAPCRPSLNGSVSGSSVKLSWSYTTSSSCGTPTTTTLKYYNDLTESWIEIKSSSASSFKSYSLSVSDYGYPSSSAGQWLLQAGISVENEYGDAYATCYCFIDSERCSCS